MKLLWAALCFLFALMTYVQDAQASLVPDKDLVRVRLLTLSQRIQISGTGLRFQNLSQPYRPVAIPNNSQVEVRLIKRDAKSFWALRLNNNEVEHLFSEKYLLIQGDGLRAGAQSLPGRVLLAANGPQSVDIVGVMPLDEYIVGVLASEMPLGWPLETLKAQAVAARSYTLAVINERNDKAYHLESSVLDQVFRHVMAEDENDVKIKKALQAVRETEGLHLEGPNHKVLKAFYHADCGGKTTTAKNVWSSGVNTGTAVDSSCSTSRSGQWRLRISKEDLARKLHSAPIMKVSLIRSPGDSRVELVKVAFNDGLEKTFNANDFRQALGFQDLRSTMFDLEAQNETYTFTGRGFGHGVGLCQWGSRALGMQGKNFAQILKHYYPLAKLAKNL
ncbi:MAG: SpoIID/LytB domain-containing protein [Bacillota bacterium]